MKKLTSVILVLSMVLALTACGSGSGSSAPAANSASNAVTYEWDYLNLDSSAYPSIPLLIEWSNQILEQTNGQLKINIRVGGELPYTTGEYLDAVSNNSVEMAGCMITAVSSYFQAGGLPSCPFMITDSDSYYSVMNVLDTYLDEELEGYNVFNAMTLFHPYQEIAGTGPVPATYKDLAGLKLRTTGAQQAKFWEAVGLVPTSIDASEVSSALNTNVIGGVTAANMAVDLNKWYESLDWIYVCHSMMIPVYVCVNNDAFNQLPADVQDVFTSVTADFLAVYPEKIIAASDQSLANMESNGLEIVYASDEDKDALLNIAVPLWDEYAKKAGGNTEKAVADIKAVLGIS